MTAAYTTTALVVDDEALVRMDLVDMLNAVGYRTREACCAAEAIEILEQDPEIRVVFTDIQMPGSMDGLALSHFVRERWPLTVIVICSGNPTPAQDEIPSGADFLSKPIGPPKLGKVLEMVALRLATRQS